ncbi:hypothetical protein HYQ46_005989 [Verticillium longisporum]|nr:hypothetical protein HYQ46_005989 [Verticillium longisporum]
MVNGVVYSGCQENLHDGGWLLWQLYKTYQFGRGRNTRGSRCGSVNRGAGPGLEVGGWEGGEIWTWKARRMVIKLRRKKEDP